jgi:two-component system, OmpR family, KDP operon response regulator KdpE
MKENACLRVSVEEVAIDFAKYAEAHIDDIEYLRVAVRGLRLKIEDNATIPVLVQNEPAVGYRLNDSL